MLRLYTNVAVVAAAALWSSAAPAQGEPYYFTCSTQISSGAITTVYSSGIFLAPYLPNSPREYAQAFKEFLIGQGLNAPYANCSTSATNEKAFRALDYSEEHALKMKARHRVVAWAPPSGQVVARGQKVTAPAKKPVEAAGSPTSPSRSSASEAQQAQTKSRAEYEAEFQAKLAAHEASVAEYKRKVAAREAEIARQQREHAQAQEQARRAQQAHAAKMTMFERVLEEQRQRQREYEAAEARHRKCVSGDQQACADIKAGKPALEQEVADAGEAKTSDDEARTCVTEPVVSASETWKNAMEAVVFNGCKTAVDVRVCLLRTGGWNCGMTLGLKPQDRWTWWSYETKGQIFWDARIAGSNEVLGSPGSD